MNLATLSLGRTAEDLAFYGSPTLAGSAGAATTCVLDDATKEQVNGETERERRRRAGLRPTRSPGRELDATSEEVVGQEADQNGRL